MKELPKVSDIYYQIAIDNAKREGKSLQNYLGHLIANDHVKEDELCHQHK